MMILTIIMMMMRLAMMIIIMIMLLAKKGSFLLFSLKKKGIKNYRVRQMKFNNTTPEKLLWFGQFIKLMPSHSMETVCISKNQISVSYIFKLSSTNPLLLLIFIISHLFCSSTSASYFIEYRILIRLYYTI